MDEPTPIHELGKLTPGEWEKITAHELPQKHQEALLEHLISHGFKNPVLTDKNPLQIHAATAEGKQAIICFGAPAATPMELAALTQEQCTRCDELDMAADVHYASLFAAQQAEKLCLLGPVPVRIGRRWQTQQFVQSQFLPASHRTTVDRFSPIFGGASLFKMDRLLIPHVLEHGELPRFEVQGLFASLEQGESHRLALMCGAPPTHFMLVEKNTATGRHEFRRPFFFYGDKPLAELELTHCRDAANGLIELMDKTGRVMNAECLEASLFPERLTAGKRYRWTLSLIADRLRSVQKKIAITSGQLYEQAKQDYTREHGEEPPADFAAQLSTENMRSLRQEPQSCYTELCGKVLRVEENEIDTQKVIQIALLAIPQNDEVEIQVFAGRGLELTTLPREGDVVECSGFLYASPDALVESDSSWQDSGEIALMQERRELEANALHAFQQFSGYSLAVAVAAAGLARAKYALVEPPLTHTRDEATFLVQDERGQKRLIFVDTLVNDAIPDFHYTDEQMQNILKRKRSAYGEEVQAHHCIVRIARSGESERYAVSMQVQPECPGLSCPISEATQTAANSPSLDEARACRIICNAVCSQDWTEFADYTSEDLSYTSHVNGTSILGKADYIRYMAERKQLWEKQQGWQGMSMETGSILCRGERRPCFMITCYGKRIGGATITLRHGLIAGMETLPLEANDSFEPDAECAAEPRIFHPRRGRLTPHPARQTPLQRFAAAYLRECMLSKTGYYGPTKDGQESLISTGLEFKLHQKGSRWVKLTRDEPSFCDLAFSHAGHVYAICTVETDLHPNNGGDIAQIISSLPGREKLLSMAERHRLIPCVFPAQRGHTPDPAQSWNLWDVRTGDSVAPELADEAPDSACSEWEALCAALVELDARVTRAGGRTLAFHDTPHLLPHYWFVDARGQLSWVVIRLHLGAMYADRGISEEEKLALQLAPEAKAYVVDAQAFADDKLTESARRSERIRIKLSELLPLD